MVNDSTITLSHGDGGVATSKLIKEEILERFGNPILNQLEDGSLINIDQSQIIISTDSFIVDPPIFPGGDIGGLSISGTVNDLLASGAAPKFITLSLIIAEGFPIHTFRNILNSAKKVSDSTGIKIVAGDTKVFSLERNDCIFINTTGLGTPIINGMDFSVSNAQIGDNIIVTGTVGNHGLAVLSAREGLGFEQRVVSDCAPLYDLIIPLIKESGGIHCMRDPTRGGVLGALFDIAESSSVDIVVDENSIPMLEEVKFGCEMLGLDPMSLVNEGIMLLVLSAEQTDNVLTLLRQNRLGINSAVIGTIHKRESKNGRVVLKKGKRRVLASRQNGQSIPRLC